MSDLFPSPLSGSHGALPGGALLAVTLVGVMLAVALLVSGINVCLNDLEHRRIVAGGNKHFWAGVIILGGPVGQIAYWLYGRGPE